MTPNSPWRPVLVALHAALILTGFSAFLSGAAGPGNPVASMIAAVILFGPLALFLPASWQEDRRLMTWFSFLLMFYFCGFVLQATNPPPSGYWGLAASALTVVLFCVIVLSMRATGKRAHD